MLSAASKFLKRKRRSTARPAPGHPFVPINESHHVFRFLKPTPVPPRPTTFVDMLERQGRRPSSIGEHQVVDRIRADEQRHQLIVDDIQRHALAGAEERRQAALVALAPIQERLAQAKAISTDARGVIDRLDSALAIVGGRVAEARVRLAAFDASERTAMEQWAQAGAHGNPPTGDVVTRRSLESDFANVQREQDHLTASKTEPAQKVQSANDDQVAAHIQLDAAIVALLYEEAEILGGRYLAALDELAAVYCELLGLNFILRSFGHVNPSYTRPAIQETCPPSIATQEWGLTQKHITAPTLGLYCLKEIPPAAEIGRDDVEAAAAVWSALVERLRDVPTARVDANSSIRKER